MGGLIGQFNRGDLRNEDGEQRGFGLSDINKIKAYQNKVNAYLNKLRPLRGHTDSSIRTKAANLFRDLERMQRELDRNLREEQNSQSRPTPRRDSGSGSSGAIIRRKSITMK